MLGRLAGFVAGTALLVAAGQTVDNASSETPRSIVRAARRAVERDSVPAVEAAWNARLQRNAADRLAALGLATIARLTYDYDGAIKRYETIIQQSPRNARERPDSIATYALLGLAWQADTRGMIARADTLFVRARAAAKRSSDRLAEAEAMMGWAFERGPIDGAQVAQAIVDSAGRLIPESATDLRAEYWVRRAVLSAVLSKPDVDREATLGRTIAQQAGELRLEAKANGAMALDRLLHGEEEDAIVLYDTVAALQRRARDFSSLSETLYRQADALRSRGDLGAFKRRALEAAQEAERSHNDIVGRSVLVGLGALALFVHDYRSADRYLSQAVERQTKDGVVAELMLSRAHRAKLYFSIGEIEKARTEMQAVIDYHRSTADGSYEFTSLRDLITIELRARRLGDARRILREAESLARRLDVKVWNRELSEDRGVVALAEGDLKTAQREFTTALAMIDSSKPVIRHAMRVRLAQVFATRGDLARAEQELVAADTELDRWRATLTDRELRMYAFQAGATEQNTRDESLSITIAALARGGRAASALQLAERRRARVLTDRVLQAKSLAETRTSGGERRANPASVVLPQQLSERGLLSAIPDRQTAVLEYVTGAMGAPTTLFVVTRSAANTPDVRGYVLPSADSLTPSITRFVGLVEAGEDPTALANSLGQALLSPAEDVLKGTGGNAITRLVIVPDGPLHNLPFDALRLSDGRFVIERFSTSLAPSGAVISLLRDRGVTRNRERPAVRGGGSPLGDSSAMPPVRLLIFGDPVFAQSKAPAQPSAEAGTGQGKVRPGAGSASAQSADTRSSDAHPAGAHSSGMAFLPETQEFEALPRLTGSAREAELIARYSTSAEVRLRDQASAAYLKQAPLDQFSVLHFATHALVNERTAARTALALTPGDGESGFVSPGELSALSLNADLVVLSACRTAGGVVIDGEGVQGLTSSFLEAGAQSVVASQWRIGDQSTVAVIGDFYDALARRLPVAEALRAAKLEAIRRGVPARDWAAFTVVGDPFVEIPLSPPVVRWWRAPWVIPAVLSALAVLGAGAMVARRRRRCKNLFFGMGCRDSESKDPVRSGSFEPAMPQSQSFASEPRTR